MPPEEGILSMMKDFSLETEDGYLGFGDRSGADQIDVSMFIGFYYDRHLYASLLADDDVRWQVAHEALDADTVAAARKWLSGHGDSVPDLTAECKSL